MDPRIRHIESFDLARRDSLNRRFKLLEEAAFAATVPCYFLVEDDESNSNPWLAVPNQDGKQRIYCLSKTGRSWSNSGIATALAAEGRACILLCGFWLETTVTFMALSALSSGFDVFVSMDTAPSRNEEIAGPSYDRLLQAGTVPTTTQQLISEWIEQSADPKLRADLSELVQST